MSREQYKAVIENLKAQEVSQDNRLKELSLFAEQEVSKRIYASRLLSNSFLFL